MEDKGALMVELKSRMEGVKPLPEEENFHTETETLMRYLKARDWNVDEAEKLLKDTVEWRRKTRPLALDCDWCHENPGFHCMRQVGFDELGRPVIYSNFAQANTNKNNIEDSIRHTVYLIENAKLVMSPGVHTWVFIIDCTGMTLPACSPRLGYGVTQILSNHYPERLGMVICINHSPVFQGVWKAIRAFLHTNTVAKVELARNKKKYLPVFQKLFSEELTNWLLEEIKLNKEKPMCETQRAFWRQPQAGVHDPRGCPSYVRDHIDTYSANQERRVHKPHPCIIDELQGKLQGLKLVVPEEENGATGSDKNDSSDLDDEVDIDEEFQIPKGAEQLH